MSNKNIKRENNVAILILIAIGGTAAMVAGYMGSYYADFQTMAKPKRKAGASYGTILRASYAKKRLAAIIKRDRAKQVIANNTTGIPDYQ